MPDLVAVDSIEPIWITRQEAAKRLSLSVRTIDELRYGNELPYVMVGTRVRIPVSGLRAWCERQERQEAAV